MIRALQAQSSLVNQVGGVPQVGSPHLGVPINSLRLVIAPVVSAPGFAYLCDAIGTAADMAFSVTRKLRAAYAGKALQIRYGVSSTYDVDFDPTTHLVDWAAAETQVAGANAFVSIIYDQSGNGFNLVQATALLQPQCIAAGVAYSSVGTQNRKGMARFDGLTQTVAAAGAHDVNPSTQLLMVSNTTTTDNAVIAGGSTSAAAIRQKAVGPNFVLDNGSELAGPIYSLATWYLVTAQAGFAVTESIAVNNGTPMTGEAGANFSWTPQMSFDAGFGAGVWIPEWVIWAATLNGTDITTVNNNSNSFYGVY